MRFISTSLVGLAACIHCAVAQVIPVSYGAQDSPSNPEATRSKTGVHDLSLSCLYSLTLGYQGLSSRSSIQRQSGA